MQKQAASVQFCVSNPSSLSAHSADFDNLVVIDASRVYAAVLRCPRRTRRHYSCKALIQVYRSNQYYIDLQSQATERSNDGLLGFALEIWRRAEYGSRIPLSLRNNERICYLGAAGIASGAFGAHALAKRLGDKTATWSMASSALLMAYVYIA